MCDPEKIGTDSEQKKNRSIIKIVIPFSGKITSIKNNLHEHFAPLDRTKQYDVVRVAKTTHRNLRQRSPDAYEYKTSDYHRDILRPPILIKMLFKKLKA